MSMSVDWAVSRPRPAAGLWFGWHLALGSLVILLPAQAISFAFFHAAPVVRPIFIVTLGACLVMAIGTGSVLGERLVKSDLLPVASDGYRVGALVGLSSGLLSVFLGVLTIAWSFWRMETEEGFHPGFREEIYVAGALAFLTSVVYLLAGVLAGWRLVSVVSARPNRPIEGDIDE